MSCQDYLHLLSEYVDQDIAESDRELLERHFEDCDNCRNFFRSFRTSIDLVKYLEAKPCPPDVQKRLSQALIEKLKKKKDLE